jgi:hypothetical protein
MSDLNKISQKHPFPNNGKKWCQIKYKSLKLKQTHIPFLTKKKSLKERTIQYIKNNKTVSKISIVTFHAE